jgi:hypothetical protein
MTKPLWGFQRGIIAKILAIAVKPAPVPEQ